MLLKRVEARAGVIGSSLRYSIGPGTRGGLRSANRGGHQPDMHHPRSPPPRVKGAWVWSTHQSGRSKAYPMRAAMQLDTVQPLQVCSFPLPFWRFALYRITYRWRGRLGRRLIQACVQRLLAKFHACGGLRQHRLLLVLLLPFFLLLTFCLLCSPLFSLTTR